MTKKTPAVNVNYDGPELMIVEAAAVERMLTKAIEAGARAARLGDDDEVNIDLTLEPLLRMPSGAYPRLLEFLRREKARDVAVRDAVVSSRRS